MKKTPAFAILILAFTLILTSCKKDSKEISIIGKWRITERGDSFYLAGNLVLDNPSEPVSVLSTNSISYWFNSDGTFSQYFYLSNSIPYKLAESGKYALTDANSTLNLYTNDSKPLDTFKISLTDKNTMVLIETITYNTPTGIGTPTGDAKFDRYDRTFTFTRL